MCTLGVLGSTWRTHIMTCAHAYMTPRPFALTSPSHTKTTPNLTCNCVDLKVSVDCCTLIPRFNKAADLLNEVVNGYYDMDIADATARLYVWLRYSATRKLTWQRNYNTQPRILSAAQERLTNTIANAHARTSGEAQEWVRLMLGCVGRGGDGQKIRDEILNIMHRNHIPERKGMWMEVSWVCFGGCCLDCLVFGAVEGCVQGSSSGWSRRSLLVHGVCAGMGLALVQGACVEGCHWGVWVLGGCLGCERCIVRVQAAMHL